MCSDGKWVMLLTHHRAIFYVPLPFCCITPQITAVRTVENSLRKRKWLCWTQWKWNEMKKMQKQLKEHNKVRNPGGRKLLGFHRHFHCWWLSLFFYPVSLFFFWNFLLFMLLVIWCLLCLPPTKQMSSSTAGAMKEQLEKKREPHAVLQPVPSLASPTESKLSYYKCRQQFNHRKKHYSIPDMWKQGKQRWRAWWRSVRSCGWWRCCKARSRTWEGSKKKNQVKMTQKS